MQGGKRGGKLGKVTVELAIDTRSSAPWTPEPEALSSIAGTQSCKNFTRLNHIKVTNNFEQTITSWTIDKSTLIKEHISMRS